MFKKGNQIELKITSLGSSGEGVGKVDGFTIFVKGALPGEKIRAKITILKKSYANAQMLQIIDRSPQRQKPFCPLFYKCGGCQLQHLSYEGQLIVKKQQVIDALERIGHIPNPPVFPVLADENPMYYRNKMLCPIASQDGTKIGFYKTGTHEIVDMQECYIQSQANNIILTTVREWVRKYKISVYNEESGKGLLRHILGRVSAATNEVMVGLVCTQKSLPNKLELVEMLKANIPNLVSVVQNLNSSNTNVIMGRTNIVLYGKSVIADKIGSFTFEISATSFFQVNTKQAEKLYQTALDYAKLSGTETVVDLYCGIGTLSLFLAQKAKNVIGVEVVPIAIDNAKENAKFNKVKNIEFICDDATVAMQQISRKNNIDVVVLDPPRAGCEKPLLEQIIQTLPQRIVYVSCNPASLARDIKILTDSGDYKLVKVQPVDMFGQTAHVETVVLMSRVEK